MTPLFRHTIKAVLIFALLTGTVFASGSKTDHDMNDHDKASQERIGVLIHESVVDGYMLAYHFLDLRDQKADGMEKASMDKTHAMTDTEIKKPHHLMVYIMDKHHKLVLKGKVGFLIKDAEGSNQKSMGMYMNRGFGTTLDMKKKGVYSVTTKAILGDKKIMDKFEYTMK